MLHFVELFLFESVYLLLELPVILQVLGDLSFHLDNGLLLVLHKSACLLVLDDSLEQLVFQLLQFDPARFDDHECLHLLFIQFHHPADALHVFLHHFLYL